MENTHKKDQGGAHRLNHLLVEIVALTCALSDSSKDRETTCQHPYMPLTPQQKQLAEEDSEQLGPVRGLSCINPWQQRGMDQQAGMIYST